MFRNVSHGGLNMVYRRSDGNIGWVDPVASAAVSPKEVESEVMEIADLITPESIVAKLPATSKSRLCRNWRSVLPTFRS